MDRLIDQHQTLEEINESIAPAFDDHSLEEELSLLIGEEEVYFLIFSLPRERETYFLCDRNNTRRGLKLKNWLPHNLQEQRRDNLQEQSRDNLQEQRGEESVLKLSINNATFLNFL